MIGAVLLVVVLAYTGACLLKGFGPAPRLGAFHPQTTVTRRFKQSSDVTQAAYRSAIGKTPGMRLADQVGSTLLADLRPTSRILGGNFGLAVRVSFTDGPYGCVVTTEGMNKVPFALANHRAAFVHAERALRMQAKASGLEETLAT